MASDNSPPSKDQYQSLVKLVEKITSTGRLTRDDQAHISQYSKNPLDKVDTMAISHLTALIKKGEVKPAD